ncbi:hypothetical protein [Streptomyces sp. NPDC059814]|uniref:hypothetical protein n=1 Tax=Streptomyces sp. NPDC059814 TaxID=3346959 RepID=UPI00364A791A
MSSTRRWIWTVRVSPRGLTQLVVLAADAPLAGLRVVGALERTSADAARAAVYAVHTDERPWCTIGTALGLTEADACTLLMRYIRRF